MTRPGRSRRPLVLLLAALLALPLLVAARAAAPLDDAEAAFRSGEPLYIAPDATWAPSTDERAELTRMLRGTTPPIYFAVLPASSSTPGQIAARIGADLNERAVYLVVAGDKIDAMAARGLLDRSASSIAVAAAREHRGDRIAVVAGFVDGVLAARDGSSGGQSATRDSSGGFDPAVLLLLPLLVLAVPILAGVLFFRAAKRRTQQRAAEELETVRPAAEEDVTRLGEDIAALDLDVDRVDEQTRLDYTRALDSFDRAKTALAAASSARDLRAVSEALEDGRYNMSCVRAALDGRPRPERRPPCFFNPQHGPSTTDAEWAPPGGAPRLVPVCAADADRLARGDDPDVRELVVAGERRPYYEAGPAYAPWFGGYYGGYGSLLPGLLVGTVIGSSLGGWGFGGYGAGYGAGYDAGFDQGLGSDGGDGGWGGGDSGGGDFGGGGGWGGGDSGGDFGGGDF